MSSSARNEAVAGGSVADEATAWELAARARLTRIASHPRGSLARYEIRRELALGGMGRILEAWDIDLRRAVALKRMRAPEPARGSPEAEDYWRALCRFLAEAQITSQLEHPGIVSVHETGVDDHGQVFFAMPLVRGRDLREIFALARARQEGWSLVRAVAVLVSVCDAIAYAHARGVVHRDLKPANVMVGPFGETYVMDWGLARVLPGSAIELEARSLPSEEGIVGTPGYMAPEQLTGGPVGPAADVYSVGALLYHLLTGETPYAEPPATCFADTITNRQVSGPPEPVQARASDAPPELCAICAAAMARDPADRYAGANGLAEDLRAYLEGHVVRAYEHGPVAELRKWVRRNPVAAVSLQLVALLLFLGVLGYALLQRGKREALAAENARTLRESYRANLHAAAASLRAGDTRDATEALDECRPAMRGFEWNHLRHRADASLRTLEVAEAPILDARLAPEGALAAVSSRDGEIAILEPTGGLILRRLRGVDGDANPIAWSPDGVRLAYAGPGGELRAHTVADERDEQLLAGSGWTLSSIAWSPDGAWIACGDVHGNLRLWDARERRAAAELRAHVETISALDFDPSGRRLASGAWDGAVAVWRVPELAPAWRAPPSTSVLVQDLCFSPDGSEIAAACTDRLVHLWPADSGAPERTLAGLEHAVSSVAYDRAGLHLVTGSDDGTTAVWDRDTGAIVHAMRGHDRGVTAVSTELEWPLIVTAGKDGSLRTWNAAGPGAVAHAACADPVSFLAYDAERTQLRSISSNGWLRSDDARTLAPIGTTDFARRNSACLSADGSTAATGAEDGEVRVLDARAGGSPLWTGRAHEGTVVCVALDPRGTRLASYGGDGAVRVRAARSGALEEEVASLPAVPKVLAFDAPGRRLAIGCVDGTVQILEDGSLRALPTSGVAIQVLALAFDPRGLLLAEGDGQGGVRIRNLATGRVQIEFDQQPRRISCLTFSSDGARLFSGAVDGSVCAWDPQYAAPLLRLSADAAVTALAVAPDASAVYAAVSDTKDRERRSGLHAWRAWPAR